jgi:hypothetical protein
MQPLMQEEKILRDPNAPTTGVGADALRTIVGRVNTVYHFLSGAQEGDLQQAKFEELKKYAAMAVNAMSPGSDARLGEALAGNPGTHISNLSNQNVIRAMIGVERMKQAAFLDAQAQNVQPRDYADFMTGWQRTHDARAFITDMLGDDDAKKMVGGMKPDEYKTFRDTVSKVPTDVWRMSPMAP